MKQFNEYLTESANRNELRDAIKAIDILLSLSEDAIEAFQEQLQLAGDKRVDTNSLTNQLESVRDGLQMALGNSSRVK